MSDINSKFWNELANKNTQLNQMRKVMSKRLWDLFIEEIKPKLPQNFEQQFECKFIEEDLKDG